MRAAAYKTFVAFLFAAQAAPAGSAIQFSTALHKFSGEGVVYQRLIFKENERKIFYLPPRGWDCSLVGNYLRLVPPDKTFADGQIAATPLEKPQPFDDATKAALIQQLIATLPPGSSQAEIVKRQDDLVLNSYPGFEVTVSYKMLGDTFLRDVLFVHTPANQIMFRLSARKSDFDALYRVFRASIFTWEWQPQPAAVRPPATQTNA